MDTGNYFKIKDGPDRSNLFSSCQHAFDRRNNKMVEFVISIYDEEHELVLSNMKVASIKHLNDTGNDFLIAGVLSNIDPFVYSPFSARYNTKSKKGSILFSS